MDSEWKKCQLKGRETRWAVQKKRVGAEQGQEGEGDQTSESEVTARPCAQGPTAGMTKRSWTWQS